MILTLCTDIRTSGRAAGRCKLFLMEFVKEPWPVYLANVYREQSRVISCKCNCVSTLWLGRSRSHGSKGISWRGRRQRKSESIPLINWSLYAFYFIGFTEMTVFSRYSHCGLRVTRSVNSLNKTSHWILPGAYLFCNQTNDHLNLNHWLHLRILRSILTLIITGRTRRTRGNGNDGRTWTSGKFNDLTFL